MFSTQEGSFEFTWNVERGFRFFSPALTSPEAAIVDVLIDFMNKGRIFDLSPKEVESYLRDENHLRAWSEDVLAEKLVGSWIRDLVKIYFSCNVTQRDFSGDFTKLDLIQKIKAIKEILRDLHLNLLGVDLVEIDGMELALKINLKKPYEEFALKGFLAFLQDYLRKYFNKEDLNLRIEKNL